MTDETQAEMPVEDVPVLPAETQDADSSTAKEAVEPQADDAGQPRDEDGKFLSKNAQKRIDELTWKAHQREREAEYWRQQALQAKPEPPKAPEPTKLPTLEEVGYDEAKYQAALIEYATKKAEEVVNSRLSEVESKRAEQQRIEAFVTRQKAFAQATPDFEDKVLRDPTLPITNAMRDVIVDSESGPEIAYYLASNREVAEQIASLPPHLAALGMGRIEGRLSALKEAKTRPVVSKAPPPPPRVDDTQTEVEKDPDEMSVDQWLKWRQKQLRTPRK